MSEDGLASLEIKVEGSDFLPRSGNDPMSETRVPPVVGPLGCPGDMSWVDNIGGNEDASGGHANRIGAEDLGVVERDEQVLLVCVTAFCPTALATPNSPKLKKYCIL